MCDRRFSPSSLLQHLKAELSTRPPLQVKGLHSLVLSRDLRRLSFQNFLWVIKLNLVTKSPRQLQSSPFSGAGKCFLGCSEDSEKDIKSETHRWLTINWRGVAEHCSKSPGACMGTVYYVYYLQVSRFCFETWTKAIRDELWVWYAHTQELRLPDLLGVCSRCLLALGMASAELTNPQPSPPWTPFPDALCLSHPHRLWPCSASSPLSGLCSTSPGNPAHSADSGLIQEALLLSESVTLSPALLPLGRQPRELADAWALPSPSLTTCSNSVRTGREPWTLAYSLLLSALQIL